jgi:UDP-N-acetylglucosamine 1-carboxyvinyltransferase
MTAALIPGRTVIRNPAREPEVGDLAGLLQQMGAGIHISSTQIEIEGRAALSGATHEVIPDRLCAGTFVIAAALTGGELFVRCNPWHLRPLTGTLMSMGVELHERPEGIQVSPQPRSAYRPVEIETRPYPGFPTDMHPPIVPLMSLTPGESRVRETVFEDRFAYAPELRRMGADLDVWGQTVILRGVRALRGAEVRARRDNRAGVALVLAGLVAEGTTIVHDEEDHIPRGHSDLAGTLRELGAEIVAEPCTREAHYEKGN